MRLYHEHELTISLVLGVVQECALAQMATLHHGRWNCSWTAGVDTARLLRRLKYASVCPKWDVIEQRASEGGRCRFSAAHWYAALIELLELSVINHASHRSPPDLLDLLNEMRAKQSINPKDKIYGLMRLGLANCSNSLEIDYDVSEEELWDRLLSHLQTCPNHPPI